jgi:hypothetical protein
MWKSIVLCVSLFGGAALGLSVGARFVEPAALPAAAAIGLCVIGIVLILSAPPSEVEPIAEPQPRLIQSRPETSVANALPPVPNRTPTVPFEALNP